MGKIGYTATPAVPEVKPFIVQGGFSWAIPTNCDPEKVNAAWEFIKWEASIETKRKMVELRGGPYYDRYSIINDPELQKIQPELAVWAKWINNITNDARPPIPVYSILQETLGTIGHKGLIGDLSVEETMRLIQNKMYTVMKRAGYYLD